MKTLLVKLAIFILRKYKVSTVINVVNNGEIVLKSNWSRIYDCEINGTFYRNEEKLVVPDGKFKFVFEKGK